MSAMFRKHTVSIERQSVTRTDSGGSQKTYNTANRGTRPTSLQCSIVPINDRERYEYRMRDQETSHKVYFLKTDPEVDELDRLVFGTRHLYVTSVRNPDELDRYWIVSCLEQSAGPK